MTPTPPWLVFADDWGRHPSSCQHLIRHLLQRIPITWVNTIGTRPPRLDWGTVQRAAGKIRTWVRPQLQSSNSTSAEDAIRPMVLSPKMWPSFQSRFARRLNRKLLLNFLKPRITGMRSPPIVVTTLPIVADLIGELPATRWVYYCVDDFSVWPGYDGATMLQMESDLVPQCETIIAVSETLQAKFREQFQRDSHLLTHGVDLESWKLPADQTGVPPEEFEHLERPIVLFWGVIDGRMDLAFLRCLDRQMTAGSIVLVGPREAPDPEVLRLQRVVHRPPCAFSRLPALAAAAQVLIMPYADIPATRAMQPLKLKEYLATGRPAVVRRLPSTATWADAADVAATPEEFAASVLARIRSGTLPDQVSARQRLEAESWSGKAKQFEVWVNREK